ncbi:MAG: hypothetical protein ACLFWL_18575 [Candidatus Brocadiia bacterium]|nr:hypothetical protein [Planctomycetota bacterium]
MKKTKWATYGIIIWIVVFALYVGGSEDLFHLAGEWSYGTLLGKPGVDSKSLKSHSALGEEVCERFNTEFRSGVQKSHLTDSPLIVEATYKGEGRYHITYKTEGYGIHLLLEYFIRQHFERTYNRLAAAKELKKPDNFHFHLLGGGESGDDLGSFGRFFTVLTLIVAIFLLIIVRKLFCKLEREKKLSLNDGNT